MRIIIFVLLLVCGCEIEEKIDRAATRCEDKILKALEGVENACLTKEEILELINSVKQNENVENPSFCEEDAVP